MPDSVRWKRGVGRRVLADDHAVGDAAAAVDDRAVQPRAAPDLDLGQQHRPADMRVGVHPRLREQHRALDRAADDAAARDQRLDRDPAPVAEVVHELGRRQLRLVGPDRPAGVVQVELRDGGGEVDVGVPVGVDGADVAPVGLGAVALADAAQVERVRDRLRLGDHARHDVLAEVVAGARVGHVALERLPQVAGVEDVDAHAGQRAVGLARHRRRLGRLLDERGDVALLVDRHDAEGTRLGARHLDAADGARAAVHDVVGQHHRVVHLVDVVAGEHEDVVGTVAGDDVLVLVDGVGGAAVPALLADALLRRQQVDELADLGAQEAPAVLQVAQQAVALVLGDDADAADARVQAVRQREIDDAELAAEVDRRLGAAVGQLPEAAAAPAGQDQRHRALGQFELAGQVFGVHRLSVMQYAGRARRPLAARDETTITRSASCRER